VAKRRLMAGLLLIALVLTACSASDQEPRPRPSQPDVALIATYTVSPGTNQEVSPRSLGKRAGALACQGWVLNPLSQGGTEYEVHLRVPGAAAAAASAALMRAVRISVVTRPLAAFSLPPASAAFVRDPFNLGSCLY
jgi:hypothetical protein